MNERIKYIRKDHGLTLEKFGERIGVQKSAVSKMENGKTCITEQMIRLICREFHVNESWLRTGSGKPYNDSLDNTVQKLADEYHLREIEVTALTEYLKLDEEHRQAFMDYLVNVIAAQSKKLHSAASESVTTAADRNESEPSVEELEEQYKKSRSDSVQNMDVSASNTNDVKGA